MQNRDVLVNAAPELQAPERRAGQDHRAVSRAALLQRVDESSPYLAKRHIRVDEHQLLEDATAALASVDAALRSNGRKLPPREFVEILKPALDLNFYMLQVYFPLHELCPELKAVRDVGNTTCASVQERGSLLATKLSSTEFVAARKDYSRLLNNNERALAGLITDVRASGKEWPVVLLRLAYRKPKGWGKGWDTMPANSPPLPEVQEHWQRLRCWITRQTSIAAYAWRLEHSLFRGFEYQVLMFADDPVKAACVTGERWSQLATKKLGIYSPDSPAQPFLPGGLIGSMQPSCPLVQARLAWYMTKRDAALRLKLPNRGRTFDHSNAPAPHRQ